jgi:recombinational DNA repair protein RecR
VDIPVLIGFHGFFAQLATIENRLWSVAGTVFSSETLVSTGIVDLSRLARGLPVGGHPDHPHERPLGLALRARRRPPESGDRGPLN